MHVVKFKRINFELKKQMK